MAFIDSTAVNVALPALQSNFRATVAEDTAQSGANLVRRKQSGRDLIQHRAEQVIVSLVDRRYLNRCAAELARRIKTTETTTNDADARGSHGFPHWMR